MRFGSVCSGIEAASVAWEPLGWKAAWFSEIEPFPCAVLAHHYPSVPNLGDMTKLPNKILEGEVEAPDVFCGGTPCQAFSVAGKRQSLDDARGNLSLVFCEIANAIDDVRGVAGQQPTIVFWENVPGVLSTKDNAFGCFLGELAGESSAIEPPRGKWTNAGCVYGPKRTVAWRVLDAQYFGVAQRRRRVFVVASARTDIDPAAILFEFDGLRRDTAPSRETREETAKRLTRGVGQRYDPETESLIPSYGIPGNWIGRKPENGGNAVEPMHDVAPCLTKTDQHGVAHPITFQETADCLTAAYGTKWNGNASATNGSLFAAHPIAYAFEPGIAKREGSPNRFVEEMSPTLRSGMGDNQVAVVHPVAYAFDSLSSNSMKSSNPISGCNQVEVSKTLDTSRGLDPSCNQGGIGVAQPMPINTMVALRHNALGEGTGFGIGEPGDPAYTLTKGHSHAVAHPIAYGVGESPDLGHCLRSGASKADKHESTTYVAQPVKKELPLDPYLGGEVTIAIDASYSKGCGGTSAAERPVVADGMAVRRLTPVECERLQGFPDNYTQIPWRKKPASECPDGPRYKALGNSWAVPNVRWIGHRIQLAVEIAGGAK